MVKDHANPKRQILPFPEALAKRKFYALFPPLAPSPNLNFENCYLEPYNPSTDLNLSFHHGVRRNCLADYKSAILLFQTQVDPPRQPLQSSPLTQNPEPPNSKTSAATNTTSLASATGNPAL